MTFFEIRDEWQGEFYELEINGDPQSSDDFAELLGAVQQLYSLPASTKFGVLSTKFVLYVIPNGVTMASASYLPQLAKFMASMESQTKACLCEMGVYVPNVAMKTLLTAIQAIRTPAAPWVCIRSISEYDDWIRHLRNKYKILLPLQ